jgi:hypothetical protein
VTNPGDLRVAPSVAPPEQLPELLAKESLLAEPPVKDPDIFYMEQLMRDDDPYGFTPW